MSDRDGAAPGPLALHTEWQPFLPRWDVILSDEGIAWRRKVDGFSWTGGCVRREVAAAESASPKESDEPA